MQYVIERNPYGSINLHMRQGEAALEPMPKTATNAGSSLMGAAGSVSLAIMISRILGLLRDVVQAKYFGAGLHTDAFAIAFRIPNLLRDLFAEGALSAAFIPTFIRRLTRGGKEQAWILANRVISALLVIMAVITLLIFFRRPDLCVPAGGRVCTNSREIRIDGSNDTDYVAISSVYFAGVHCHGHAERLRIVFCPSHGILGF
jgi:hypothetical protein